ncbi:hypothetical protein V6Z12_D09G052800 [Gossypium hirsutum]
MEGCNTRTSQKVTHPITPRGENVTKKTLYEIKREGCNTRTSQEVTHPSTTLAQARLTAEF